MENKRKSFLGRLVAAGLAAGVVLGATDAINNQHVAGNDQNQKIIGNVLTDPQTQVKNGPEVYSLEGQTPEGLKIYRELWKEIEPIYNKLKEEERIVEDSQYYNSMTPEEQKYLKEQIKQNISKAIKIEIARAVERTGIECSPEDIELFFDKENGAGFILKEQSGYKVYASGLDGTQHVGTMIGDPIEAVFEDWDNEKSKSVPIETIMEETVGYYSSILKNYYITYDGKQFLGAYVKLPYKEDINKRLDVYKEKLEKINIEFKNSDQMTEEDKDLKRKIASDYMEKHICTEMASIITDGTGNECPPEDVYLSIDKDGNSVIYWIDEESGKKYSCEISETQNKCPKEIDEQIEAWKELRTKDTVNNYEELNGLVSRVKNSRILNECNFGEFNFDEHYHEEEIK